MPLLKYRDPVDGEYKDIYGLPGPEGPPGPAGPEGAGTTERAYTSLRRTAVVQPFTSAAANVAFEIADDDNGIPYNTSTQTWTIPLAGYYDISAAVHLAFGGTVNTYRTIGIYVNGATQGTVQVGSGSAGGTSPSISRCLLLAAGDQITIKVYQGSGATLNSSGGAAYNWCAIAKVPTSYPVNAAAYGERVYSSSRRHNGGLALPAGQIVYIPFNVEDYTDGIPFSGDTFTIPVTGYYQINAAAKLNTTGTGHDPMMGIVVNGSGQVGGLLQSGSAASAAVSGQINRLIKLTAGDLVQIRISSTIANTLNTSAFYNWVNITKVPAPVVPAQASSGVFGAGELNKLVGILGDSLGREIFTDSKGQLRAKPDLIYPTAVNVSDLIGSYPLGLSLMTLTTAMATAGGWPYNASAHVLTGYRADSPLSAASAGFQIWIRNTYTAAMEMQFRSGSISSGWSPWQSFAGADSGWQDLVFDTDWINYGGIYQLCQYRKTGNKVTMRGLAKVTAVKTATTVIATLPVGFRPLMNEIFNMNVQLQMITGAASTGTAHTHTATYQIGARVDVASTGIINCTLSAVTNIPANSYLSLSPISFFID